MKTCMYYVKFSLILIVAIKIIKQDYGVKMDIVFIKTETVISTLTGLTER
jgi:hypothetical protein